jgi:regulatory protein
LVTVTSLKTGTDLDVLRIGLSDGSLFSLRLSYLQTSHQNESLYQLDNTITDEHAQDLREAAACFRCERAALSLVARAEQSSSGIKPKLEKRGHPTRYIKKVVARLINLEIIDDARYAERWLSSRINQLNGTPLKFLSGLCSRGINRETASSVLKAALTSDIEYELIQVFVRKKRLDCEDLFLFKRALLAEGFSKRAIQRFLEDGEE